MTGSPLGRLTRPPQAPPESRLGSRTVRVIPPTALLRQLELEASSVSQAGVDDRRSLDVFLDILGGSGAAGGATDHAEISGTMVLGAGILTAMVMAVAVAALGAPIPFVLIGGLAGLLAIFQRPDLATPVFLFVMYLNLPVIATQFHGVPAIVAAGAVLVLFVPVGYHLVIRRGPVVATAALAFMVAYLLASLVSTLFASDVSAAFQRVIGFLTEGLLLYVLVSNAVRTRSSLRVALWAILLAGACMGATSIWQEMTGSYGNELGGLAQVTSEGFDTTGGVQPRLSGPIGEKNRYAQVLIVLLPIGLYLARRERRNALRLLAGASTLLVLAGIVLSFSRGGFIALVGLIVVATVLGSIRPRLLATALVGGGLVLILFAPSYAARMASIADVAALFGNPSAEPDGAILGRTTSNLAALQVFLAHPVIGVGPGQYYAQYSQEIANQLNLRRFDTQRRAHNLYLEMAADLGLMGLGAFLFVVVAALIPLWGIRQRWRLTHPERADLATAMGLALVAYLFSAVFLHLSYERYFWVLMALVASTAWILAREHVDDRGLHSQVATAT